MTPLQTDTLQKSAYAYNFKLLYVLYKISIFIFLLFLFICIIYFYFLKYYFMYYK